MELTVEARRVFAGHSLDAYALVRNGRCGLVEFLEALSEQERDKMNRLIVTFCQLGPLGVAGKYRKLYAREELYELKADAIRVPLFWDGPQRVVLTHGFRKRQDRTPPQEIERALRLRQEHIEALGGHGDGR